MEDGAGRFDRRALSTGSVSHVSEDFRSSLEHVKAQLKYHNRFVLDPRHSRWLQYWDAVFMACMIYTCVITPVEICMYKGVQLGDGETSFTIMFFGNQLVNVCFAVDLVMNFFLAYQEMPHDGGRWVTDVPLIRRKYLRGWFCIDLISLLPFDLLEQLGMLQSGATTTSTLRLTRALRLVRLLKLLRVLRGSRLASRWQDNSGLSYAQVSMIKFFSATFFMVHLMACAWAYVGLNWEPTQGATLDWEQSWIVAYNFTGTTSTRLYATSLYISVVAMFGGKPPPPLTCPR